MTAHRPEEQGVARLLDTLDALGYSPLTSVWDLAGWGRRYRSAVPALITALNEVQDGRQKEGIVRALSVPWAVEAVPALIEQFRTVEDSTGLGLRWAIGNALEVTWDDAYFDELVELACDPAFGRAREMIVLGFKRSKRLEAGQVLVGLLGDDDVNGHAVKAISKFRIPEARVHLEPLTQDDRGWVRKEAVRALARLSEAD
jgi:HEAT repeat protein